MTGPVAADRRATTRARADLRADKELVRRAGHRLRHAATQGYYRGHRRPEHAYALASILDAAELGWNDLDEPLRAELRRCCRVLLDDDTSTDAAQAAPDGPR